MKVLRVGCTTVILACAVLGAPRGALADGGRNANHRPDVDIESLKAELYRESGEWLLQVRYDVEVEDYLAGGALELVVFLTEDGYDLTNRDGQRIEYLQPLDRPTEVDRDELEYESAFTAVVPDRAVRDPGDLRVHAVVFSVGEEQPLDHEDTRVRYKKAYVSGGFSVGISLGSHAPRCRPRIYFGKRYDHRQRPQYRRHRPNHRRHFGRCGAGGPRNRGFGNRPYNHRPDLKWGHGRRDGGGKKGFHRDRPKRQEPRGRDKAPRGRANGGRGRRART